MRDSWGYADLDPRQLALVTEAERTLETDVVMVYKPARWGTIDSETVSAEGLRPVQLDATQLECLQGLEPLVGGVVVAYERTLD